MKHQRGSTLVVSLVLLTIITLVATYALEGSSIQAKMVANSLFSSLTHQECRNEQEAEVRFFNTNGGTNRNLLFTARESQQPYTTTETNQNNSTNPPTSTLAVNWTYIKDAPASRGGYNVDSESQSKAYIYEGDCNATFRFATNSQTLGAVVEGLVQAGTIN